METQRPYFGTLSSLYSSLDGEAIMQLERAIEYRGIGLYNQARAIFTNELSRWNHVPVVFLEDAELSLQQGRFVEIWNMLNKRLEALNHGSGEAEVDLDAQEYRLMSMLLALAALHHKGILETALKEIDRTRAWLQDVPVEEYTDVQVRQAYDMLFGSIALTLLT